METAAVTAGDREATFQLINGVAIKGGYAGFGEATPNARDIELYETILSGDLAGNDTEVDDLEYLRFDPCRADNSYRVVTGSWTDANAVLDGFTITAANNDRTGFPTSAGGGIFIYEGNPTITNCILSTNAAGDWGGGMYAIVSQSYIYNCIFIGNYSISGGGLCTGASNSTISNCKFIGNQAVRGAGVRNISGDIKLMNCLFVRNSASTGGGLASRNSNPTLTNCTFSENLSGGGIYNSNGTPILTNCILWGDTPVEIYGDTPTVTYSDVGGGWPGLGNIDADPCFADANNGDYHLRPDSPCINAGDPNYVAAPNEIDLDGNERVLGGRIDMGAYEYQVPTIYVDTNAPGPTHDGSRWANAYKHLQDALADADSAAKPVEIKVAQGVYKPDQSSTNPNGTGDRTDTFQLINGVTIQGGYAGYGEPDPNTRDIELYETILNGDLNGDDLPVYPHNTDDNSYRVVTGSGTEPNAVLDGLTISGGLGTGMYNYGGSPAVADCTFSDNMAGEGGAMYNEDSNTVVTGCAFVDNSAFRFGGAVYNKDCSPTFDYCTFSDNLAENGGGGMYNNYSSPILTNCTFERNWSGLYGGGLDTVGSSSSPTVIGCTFIGNSADRRGGGTSNGTSSLTLINCIFVDNSAADEGGAMNSCNGRNINVSNCTFYGNQAPNGNLLTCSCSQSNVQFTNCIMSDGGNEIWNPRGSIITLTYSDVCGGRMSAYDPCESLIWGEGNIDADPCFADANNGDYHLKSQAGRWNPNSKSWIKDDVTSPCIDAANPGCPVGDEPAPNGNRRNMGAYGGTAEASKSPTYWRSIADTTNDWVVDSNDLKVFVGCWLDTGECLPGDFDRSRSVDFNDFAILGGQWRQKGPGPTTSYQVGTCVPPEFGLSETGPMDPTRFTVTVQGQYILFEDMMQANCCPDEIELQMTADDDLITIYEIERLIGVPCPCYCNYPITATLGPFQPGSYTLDVYEDGTFIGTTTVDITPGG